MCLNPVQLEAAGNVSSQQTSHETKVLDFEKEREVRTQTDGEICLCGLPVYWLTTSSVARIFFFHLRTQACFAFVCPNRLKVCVFPCLVRFSRISLFSQYVFPRFTTFVRAGSFQDEFPTVRETGIFPLTSDMS